MNNKISLACSPALLVALLLGGCTIKPPSTDEMMDSIASIPSEDRVLSPLLTSGDFCVAVSRQKVLAQPCSGKDDQLFEWDLGELRLQDLCLQAKSDSEVMLAPCDGQAQWEWQKDRLFNSKVSRCLDVAGRRHTPRHAAAAGRMLRRREPELQLAAAQSLAGDPEKTKPHMVRLC